MRSRLDLTPRQMPQLARSNHTRVYHLLNTRSHLVPSRGIHMLAPVNQITINNTYTQCVHKTKHLNTRYNGLLNHIPLHFTAHIDQTYAGDRSSWPFPATRPRQTLLDCRDLYTLRCPPGASGLHDIGKVDGGINTTFVRGWRIPGPSTLGSATLPPSGHNAPSGNRLSRYSSMWSSPA